MLFVKHVYQGNMIFIRHPQTLQPRTLVIEYFYPHGFPQRNRYLTLDTWAKTVSFIMFTFTNLRSCREGGGGVGGGREGGKDF